MDRARTSGPTIIQVAEELGLHETVPRRWIRRFVPLGTGPARRPSHSGAGSPRCRGRPRSVEIIKRSDAGLVVQPKRWVVERTFAWVGINRRLARDFERFAETAKALLQLAMIKLMARRIARYRDFLSQTLRASPGTQTHIPFCFSTIRTSRRRFAYRGT